MSSKRKLTSAVKAATPTKRQRDAGNSPDASNFAKPVAASGSPAVAPTPSFETARTAGAPPRSQFKAPAQAPAATKAAPAPCPVTGAIDGFCPVLWSKTLYNEHAESAKKNDSMFWFNAFFGAFFVMTCLTNTAAVDQEGDAESIATQLGGYYNTLFGGIALMFVCLGCPGPRGFFMAMTVNIVYLLASAGHPAPKAALYTFAATAVAFRLGSDRVARGSFMLFAVYAAVKSLLGGQLLLNAISVTEGEYTCVIDKESCQLARESGDLLASLVAAFYLMMACRTCPGLRGYGLAAAVYCAVWLKMFFVDGVCYALPLVFAILYSVR